MTYPDWRERLGKNPDWVPSEASKSSAKQVADRLHGLDRDEQGRLIGAETGRLIATAMTTPRRTP